MATSSPQPNGSNGTASTLNASLRTLNSAKDACSIPPAQVAFDSVIIFLIVIRDTMANKHKYVYLGSTCASVCAALDRALNGRQLEELNGSVLMAIQQLVTAVTEMQKKIFKQRQRNAVSRLYHATRGEYKFAVWIQELHTILQVFNTQLSVNNHITLLDDGRDVQAVQGGADRQIQSTRAQVLAVETHTSGVIKDFCEVIGAHSEGIEDFIGAHSGGIEDFIGARSGEIGDFIEAHSEEIQETFQDFCTGMAGLFQKTAADLNNSRVYPALD